MQPINYPLLTRELSRSQFAPNASATYVYGLRTGEDRNILGSDWRTSREAAGVSFVEVVEDAESLTFTAPSAGLMDLVVPLDNQSALRDVLVRIGGDLYLDITAFTYRGWVPLIRAGIDAGGQKFTVVYVEPAEYKRSLNPAPGLIYDLSDRIEGIAPLPGFQATPTTDP